MNSRIQGWLLVSAALLAGSAFATAPRPQGPDLQERVTVLEARVADLVAKLEDRGKADAAARDQAASDRLQMEGVLSYLKAQSESAKALEAALAESRERGFTYGINPGSREVLLAGMNQFVTTLQTNVPMTPQPQPAEPEKPTQRATQR